MPSRGWLLALSLSLAALAGKKFLFILTDLCEDFYSAAAMINVSVCL